ncbi:fatty acid desaturase family protein [Paremcibacter congregatus]|uniref:fatty acid desaturase family protein n=1 Tax=Paremcibacter congregatus TaxID=2043170 RepID=UPI003A8DEA42
MLNDMKIKAADFPLKEARALVKDLMKANPVIYWVDFLLSVALGAGAFAVTVWADTFSVLGIVAYLVAVFALYRAVIFIHEIVHFKKGSMTSFRFAWNVLCGFFVLVPAFMYQGVHIDHHKRDVYGTKEDGEYLPFGAQAPWKNVWYVMTSIFLPGLVAVRYLILTPLGWIIPPLGRLLWQRASSLTIDMDYRRPPPTELDGKYWRLQEVCATVYGWTAVTLGVYGILPVKFFAVWYAVVFLVLFMNSIRTLGAHAYRNPGDQKMSVAEQFLDSVDVPGGILSALWAPVGLRFHATHHLFPNMPYHSLGTAYARLKKDLPNSELYLEASRPTLAHAMVTLWRDARASQQKKS